MDITLSDWYHYDKKYVSYLMMKVVQHRMLLNPLYRIRCYCYDCLNFVLLLLLLKSFISLKVLINVEKEEAIKGPPKIEVLLNLLTEKCYNKRYIFLHKNVTTRDEVIIELMNI